MSSSFFYLLNNTSRPIREGEGSEGAIHRNAEEIARLSAEGELLNFVESKNGNKYGLDLMSLIEFLETTEANNLLCVFPFGVSGVGKTTFLLADGSPVQDLDAFGFGVDPDQIDGIIANLENYIANHSVSKKVTTLVQNLRVIPVYLEVDDTLDMKAFITERLALRGDDTPENIASRVHAARTIVSCAHDYMENGRFADDLIRITVRGPGIDKGISDVATEFIEALPLVLSPSARSFSGLKTADLKLILYKPSYFYFFLFATMSAIILVADLAIAKLIARTISSPFAL